MLPILRGMLLCLCVAGAQAAWGQTPAKPGPEPEKFAVLVGVELQQAPAVRGLKGPANDVKIMRELLVQTYKFRDDPDHITVLTGKNATLAAIRGAFRRQLIEKAKAEKTRGGPEPIVVFYFSGHGSVITDHNNDEGDGIDETLVAYDSRAPGGKDLIDDEIDSWFDELRTATRNVTFILDSCHSGTATRAPDQVARELPPNPNMGGAVRARGVQDSVSPGLLKALQFTAVAGALANELSYEGDDIPGAKKVWHGYLTWNLVQTLKQRPDITWQQALVLTRIGMATVAPGQHPQVEGDIDRIPFGGVDDVAQPAYSLETVSADRKTLTIGAGSPNGLAEGSLVAIYDPTARSLRGPEKRLATARVIQVGLSQSTAQVVGAPPAALPPDAKVTILSASVGATPPTLKLDALPDQLTTQADRDLLAKVAKDPGVEALTSGGRVKLTTGAEPYLYAIQRACRDSKGSIIVTYRGEPAAGCPSAYYIATRQSRRPLFAYSVSTTDPKVVEHLAEAVDRLENQADLRSQVNKASRLTLKLALLDITPAGAGPPKITPHLVNGLVTLKIGQTYTFEITNTSPEDVYVTFLVAGSSGSVIPLTASANGDLLKQGVTMRLPVTLTAGEPLGLETYKVFAATDPKANFRTWVRTGLKSKDPGMGAKTLVDDWTTAEMDIQIEAKP